jgi:flagellar biosynthetic protein FlhB
MADDAGKTEKPTPKKLRDARKEGQFPRTQDAATWAAIAAATAMLPFAAGWTQTRFQQMFARIPDVIDDPEPARAFQMLSDVPMAIAVGAGPVCAAAAVAAFVATAAQGVHPSGKALKPKFSRLNPGSGLKRMFGPRSAWEALKALIKVTIVGVAVVVVGRRAIPELAGHGAQPLGTSLDKARDALLTTLWAAVVAGVLIAAADYSYQRRQVLKQLRMSMFEIKQEHKQSEGDPQVKAAIRAKQLAMSRNRMMASVATADVVVVNPTHLAVALKYQVGAGAPRVVAKGAGGLALRIREKAREARVPVIEDKPLCRVIYRACEVDDEIPAELYAAVARILAFVMAAGRPRTNDGARRTPTSAPVPTLPTRSQLKARRAREVREAREKR